MSNKKHIYYVEAVVEVEVQIRVVGTSEQEAFSRLHDGAWHGVIPNWDKAKIKATAGYAKGPGIN
jgi:hypothetical protein